MLTIIESLLSPDEVQSLLSQLRDAPWSDGSHSAGTRSINVKQNLQLGRQEPLSKELGNIILRKLGEDPDFVSASLAEKIWPPIFNLYKDGGHYGTHTDAALMRLPEHGMTLRSDLSATLFLSSPESYDGGELLIEGQFGVQAVKLAAGDMLLYSSSSLHRVAPVTKGQRICAITWIQSAVADAAAREMLYDLDQSIQALTPDRPKDDPEINRLIHVYHNLLRRWATL